MENNHIKKLISALNKLKLRYAFTGAFAVSYYGFPRLSADIDVLIEKNKDKLLELTRTLRNSGFDITETDVQKAVDECSHFPVFHKEKMFPYFDFKVACEKDERSSILNCKTINYHGLKCEIVSVEDLLIKKLEWNDTKDVEIILKRSKEIDMAKLDSLAKKRSVFQKLKKIKNSIET
jgi:hypothetical protein